MNWWETNVELRIPLLQLGSDPENILAVSHSACIKGLFKALLEEGRVEKPPGFVKNHCYNASITTIEIRRDGSAIFKKHCDVSHLRSIHYYDSDTDET